MLRPAEGYGSSVPSASCELCPQCCGIVPPRAVVVHGQEGFWKGIHTASLKCFSIKLPAYGTDGQPIKSSGQSVNREPEAHNRR
jgi:hypothetical protein